MSVANVTIPFPYVSVIFFPHQHTQNSASQEMTAKPRTLQGTISNKIVELAQRAMTHRNALISTAANNLRVQFQMLPINISQVSPRGEGGHSRRSTCVSESSCVNGKRYMPDLHSGGANRSASPL